MCHLVLGGIRSGKSVFAERLIMQHPGPWCYVATAEIFDAEMQARVAIHQARRGEQWQDCHAPLDLAQAIEALDKPGLVDCVSMWVSNLLLADADLEQAQDDLIAAVQACQQPLVLVSNEVGLGGISANSLQRRFADACGRINQALAQSATCVDFVAAGLPFRLKPA